MSTLTRTREDVLSEMKDLKPGDRISCYADRDFISGTVKYIEVQNDGDEEDVQVWFVDDGLVEGEDGEYYDEETGEPVYEYVGWCTCIEYLGKTDEYGQVA